MMHSLTGNAVLAACFAAAGLLCGAAAAQDYPNRPIRLVVPAAPGGVTDLLARRAASYLDTAIGQRIVVEHRAGAGGTIGVESVAKAAPDGYSLCLIQIGDTSIKPHLVKDLPYDPFRDLVPVAPMATLPLIVNIHPSVQANTLVELIALAKRQPGKLNYGSAGTGTSLHLGAELFMQMSGTQMVHVPYKGLAPALVDLLAGQIQVVFTGLAGVRAHIDKGSLKGLAVAQSARLQGAPNIPSADEAGLPGYEFVTWFGFVSSRGTPPAIVNTLNRHINAMLDDPAVVQGLVDGGMGALKRSPEAFAALIKSDYDKYGRIVRAANIKPE